jgi:hypothetical protein
MGTVILIGVLADQYLTQRSRRVTAAKAGAEAKARAVLSGPANKR